MTSFKLLPYCYLLLGLLYCTESAPVFTNLPDSVSIPVLQPAAVPFFTVKGFDNNANAVLTYSISPPLDNVDIFDINPNTGEVSVKSPSPLPSSPPNVAVFEVDVIITDGTATTTSQLRVILEKPGNQIPQATNLPNTITLPVNQAAGVVLYTIGTSDGDGEAVLLFLSQQNPVIPALFDLNSNSGELSLKIGSTFYTLPSTQSSIDVDVFLLNTIIVPVTLTINIDRISGNLPPTITNLPQTINLPIGQPNGETFYNVKAADLDMDVLVYSIQDTFINSLLNIDSTNGQLSVKSPTSLISLPASTTTLSVPVIVSDRSTSAVMTLTINLIRPNSPPTFTNLPGSQTIPLSQPLGQTLFTVIANDSDGDTLTYMLTNPTSFLQSLFDLNMNSGAVSLKIGIGGFPVGTQVTLNMQVSDGKTTVSGDLTLTMVAPILNTAPIFSSNFLSANVAEGPAGTQVLGNEIMAAVSDPGDTLTFSVVPDSPNFAINPTTGLITFKTDYFLSQGLPSQVALTVRATDTGGLFAEIPVFVTINQNNEPPSFTNLPANTAIPISQAIGQTFYTVAAADPNGHPLTYSLSSVIPSNLFQISPGGNISAVVSLAAGIPPTTQVIDLDVIVTDSLGASTTSTLTVILDRTTNDPPIFTNIPNSLVQNLPTSTAINQQLFTVEASDANIGDVLTFSLQNPNSFPASLFSIDASTGVVRLISDISGFPPAVPLALVIDVSDGTDTTSETLSFITTTVMANLPPFFTNLPVSYSLANIQPVSQTFYQVNATDPNSGDVLSFSFQDPNGFPATLFSIDSASGAISIRLSISSFQAGTLGNLNVNVSDGTETVTQTLSLTITSPNVAPIFNPSSFTRTVDEGPAGSVVFDQLLSSLSDPGDTVQFSFLIPSPFFTINSATGAISYTNNYFLSAGLPTAAILQVVATDTGGLTAQATVSLSIQRPVINDNDPMFSNLPEFVVISRFQAPDQILYTVDATDLDAGSSLTYSLETHQDVFNINTSSGAVSLRADYTFDNTVASNQYFTLQIRVSDGQRSTTNTLTVVAF